MGAEQLEQGVGTTTASSRPGAMTVAMQAVSPPSTGPKALHIGVARGDYILEERIVPRGHSVRVGTSEQNDLIIGGSDAPASLELFRFDGGQYRLRLAQEVTGRVSVKGKVADLAAWRGSSSVQAHQGVDEIALGEEAKGRVGVGDTFFLFEFVTPPPPQPRPQLPASVRGGFVKEMDWTFTAFVVLSYMLFFGAIVFLESYDYPVSDNLQKLRSSEANVLLAEPLPPEEQITEETDEEAEGQAEKTTPTPAPRPKAKQAESAPGEKASAEERAKIAEAAASRAEAMILGALGSSGALADVLAGGAVTGNAEDVLAQAAGVGVAERGASGLRTREGGGSGSGSLGDLRSARGAGKERGEGGAVTERRVRGKINMGSGGDTGGSGEFDSATVVRTIRARLRAIQRCYENELKSDPSLAGKVAVSFTIQPSGSVSGAKAVENTSGSSGLASCIVSTIRRLRFNPGPEGGSVSYSYPFVFAPQN